MTLKAESSPLDILATGIPGRIKGSNGKSGLNTVDVFWSCKLNL